MPGRPEELLGRMTLDEKIAQLGGVWMNRLVDARGEYGEASTAEAVSHGIGHVTRIGGGSTLTPKQVADVTNHIQRFLTQSTRLNIPAIVHEEAVAGLSIRGATQFPQAIGLAATWDPDLVERMAQTAATQMRAVGATQALSPVLDIARDPRWGRTEETYGEDPYLASRLGVAYVRGLQSSSVAATGKHFIGYGLSEGGRNHGPVHLGPRELREVFAAPFRAAINEAGLTSIMNAYNSIDGLPCAGSPAILKGLLRDELGFRGVVVADYFAVTLLQSFHRVAADDRGAAIKALTAGIDVELPALSAYKELRDADQPHIDEAVLRILRMKEELGLFNDPYVDPDNAVLDTDADRALAREIARRSLVLLHNDGLLPLSPDARIAVIGDAGEDPRRHLGDYHYPAHQEAIANMGALVGPHLVSVPMTSIADTLGAPIRAGDDIEEAERAARDADVAVVVCGVRSGLTMDAGSGEFRDVTDLRLPVRQRLMVEVAASTGTPVVLVVVSGRAHALADVADYAGAIVYAWLPGEEGGPALADVLLGRASPSGRLPVSLARSAGQLPVHYNHRSGGGRSEMYGDYVDSPAGALFPFGHGLAYTTFEYAGLEVEPGEDALVVACTVTNTGTRAGEEVVQLYLRNEVAPVVRPVRQLAGFGRVSLEAGQSRRVRFEIDPAALGFYDEDMRFVVEPGRTSVMVGASSADVRLTQSVEIAGGRREADPNTVRPARVDA